MQEKSMRNKIEKIKKEIQKIGDMRPGSLTKQYTVCGKSGCRCADPQKPKKHGPYYQLSYVYKGKSTSQFIRAKHVKDIKLQIKNYKRFKELSEKWLDIAIEYSKMKLKQD